MAPVTDVRLSACACCAALALAACKGSGGSSGAAGAPDASVVEAGSDADLDAPLELPDVDPTPPASISGVAPPQAFLARSSQLTIGGYSTSWSDATRVDLGPEVTIASVMAASPNALVVDFTVAPDAAPGPRDVTVLDADAGSETAPGSWTLQSPVALTFDGTLAQGSIVVAHVTLIDHSIALDPVSLTPVLSSGLSGTVLDATTTTADVQVFIDVPATGTGSLDLVSGGADAGDAGDVHFPAPSSIPASARAPVALVPGVPASGSVASTDATTLFAYTPSSPSTAILDFAASSSAAGATPAVLLLPASGAWSDELTGGAQATWLSTSTDPIYAVYFDASGATGAFTVNLTATPPAATAQASASDATMAGAVTATALPFVLTGGQLTSATSQDWVRVTTGPTDGGKKLWVQSAGDPRTFLDATVYDADGVTSLGSEQTGGPVQLLAGPVAASTTYYVVFSAGAGFDPAHGGYAGIVRTE